MLDSSGRKFSHILSSWKKQILAMWLKVQWKHSFVLPFNKRPTIPAAAKRLCVAETIAVWTIMGVPPTSHTIDGQPSLQHCYA